MNTNAQAGGHPDLLSSIMGVTIRNEEKIATEDREFCEERQTKLYATLRQLQWWYSLFKANAEPYRELYNLTYEENGSVDTSRLRRFYHNEGRDDYSAFAFRPFEPIDTVVKLYGKAVKAFADDIVRHFNDKYGVSVPLPDIDREKLRMGTMPTYQPHVDSVIAYLGGKDFRETAESELIARLHKEVMPGYSKKSKAELKGNKIVFLEMLWYEDYTWHTTLHLGWSYMSTLNTLCAGIVFGSTESLNGGMNYIVGYDHNDVDVSRWYALIGGSVEVKFFKNRRVDFRFENAAAAERCWRKLRLDTFNTSESHE